MNTNDLEVQSTDRIAHNFLCKNLFNLELSPMIDKYGAVMVGFTLKNNELTFNSFASKKEDDFHDYVNFFWARESALLSSVLLTWQDRGCN